MEAQAPGLLTFNDEPVEDRRLAAFIAPAEAFIAAHRQRWVFRALRWYLGATECELDLLIGKLYCLSIPENTFDTPESWLKTYLGLFVLPFHFAATKQWHWTATPRANFQLDVFDENHFRRTFARFYAGLRGSKRLTPHSALEIAGQEVTLPSADSVCLADLARLALLVPLLAPALLAFSWRSGVNIVKAYRQALSIFTVFHGYFRRFPCAVFITYADEVNHPARHVAFRRAGGLTFAVAQNGERTLHPIFAYGLVDVYFTCGVAYEGVLRRLKVAAREFVPVGAPYLNEHYAGLRPHLSETARRPEYDVLFIDQGVYGLTGFNERSARSLEVIFHHLNEYKRRHPKTRVVYQLRPWRDRAQKQVLLDALRRHFTEDIPLLENSGSGESYRNILRSELVITFESSMGFEAMMLGRKALFVNFSGDPTETLCPDPRFQIDDPTGDYASFEAKIDELLALKLDRIPRVAADRHHAVDGQVEERMGRYFEEGRAS